MAARLVLLAVQLRLAAAGLGLVQRGPVGTADKQGRHLLVILTESFFGSLGDRKSLGQVADQVNLCQETVLRIVQGKRNRQPDWTGKDLDFRRKSLC